MGKLTYTKLPLDRSTSTYKAWVLDIVAALGGELDDDLDEAGWDEECAAFWQRADDRSTTPIDLSEPDPADLRRRLDSLAPDD